MANLPGPSRGRARGLHQLHSPRTLAMKQRQADARWRSSIQACYTLLQPVLQSRHPSVSRAAKPRLLEAVRQHVLELEQALAMLLDIKNSVIQSLFEGGASPPRLSVDQYKALFLGLYPMESPTPATPCPAPSCQPAGPAGDEPPPPPPPEPEPQPEREPANEMAELARLLHDAYDAEAGQTPSSPPPTLPATTTTPMPVSPPPPVPVPVPTTTTTQPAAEVADDADGGAALDSLPDVEENLSLELPSLETVGGWSEYTPLDVVETVPAWQELERTAQSLSMPAHLDDFTKIQRSDWDPDSPSVSSQPQSHLSPLSPEMALPAFCSTPDGAAGDALRLVTPPPGAGSAKRAGSAAAARRADRCRRALLN